MKRILLTAMGFAFLSASSFGVILINEPFNYNDGALTTVSGGAWINHSGTLLQQDVESGMVNLTQTESEDTHRNFVGPTGGTIWTGVDVIFSALPNAGAGTYFLHYSDGGASNFRGRVFATTTGAGAGKFRIGVAENAGAATFIATDLNLSQTYRILLSCNETDNSSSVEVVGVGSANASEAGAIVLSAINLRQSNASGGMGVMKLDNMIVATTRAEAVPEPASLFGLGSAVALLAARRRRRK